MGEDTPEVGGRRGALILCDRPGIGNTATRDRVGTDAEVLQGWANWVRHVKLSSLAAVRCPDADTADRVMAVLRKNAERVGATMVVLDTGKLGSEALAKLRDQGVLVAGQTDGPESAAKKKTQKSARRFAWISRRTAGSARCSPRFPLRAAPCRRPVPVAIISPNDEDTPGEGKTCPPGRSRAMASSVDRLCDAEGLAALLRDLAAAIASGRTSGAPLRLIGVRSRGHPLAQRLAALLGPLLGETVPVGAVDITLYRDDLNRPGPWPVLRGTDIPFPVEGAEIVLVDDVLHTGRTVRAALNSICDLGRPARVRLVALVDRGGRELPIQPDLTGLRLELPPTDRVIVRLLPDDGSEEIVRGAGA